MSPKPDHRITRTNVLAAIYSHAHRRRVIWSPGTTLAAMNIERYPHVLPHNYRRMKAVLAALCDEGRLSLRPRSHKHFTLNEIAYERALIFSPSRKAAQP